MAYAPYIEHASNPLCTTFCILETTTDRQSKKATQFYCFISHMPLTFYDLYINCYTCQALHLIFGIPVIEIQDNVARLHGKSSDVQAQCNEWLTECTGGNFDPYRVEIRAKYKSVFECFSSVRAMYGLGSDNRIVNCFTKQAIPSDTDVAFGMGEHKHNAARDGLQVKEEEVAEKRRLMQESVDEGDYEAAAALKKEIRESEEECHVLKLKADKFDKMQAEVRKCEAHETINGKRPRSDDDVLEAHRVEMFTAFRELAEKNSADVSSVVSSVASLARAMRQGEATTRDMYVKLTECVDVLTSLLKEKNSSPQNQDPSSSSKCQKRKTGSVATLSDNEEEKKDEDGEATPTAKPGENNESCHQIQPEPVLGSEVPHNGRIA